MTPGSPSRVGLSAVSSTPGCLRTPARLLACGTVCRCVMTRECQWPPVHNLFFELERGPRAQRAGQLEWRGVAPGASRGFPRASPRPLAADALALARCQWQPQAASGNSAEAATASGNLKIRVEPDRGCPGPASGPPGGAGSRPPLRRRRVWAHGALGAGPALTRRRLDRAEDRPLGRGCQWAGSPSAMGP